MALCRQSGLGGIHQLCVAAKTPDYSSLSIWRDRLSLEAYQGFTKVLAIVKSHKLLDGRTPGIDATSLASNAAMQSILRKETQEGYQGYLNRLRAEAGEDGCNLDEEHPL